MSNTLKIMIVAVACLLVISTIGLVGVLSIQEDVVSKDRQMLSYQDDMIQLQRALQKEQENRTVAETQIQQLQDNVNTVLEQNKQLKEQQEQEQAAAQLQQANAYRNISSQGNLQDLRGTSYENRSAYRHVNGQPVRDAEDTYSYGNYRYLNNRNLNVVINNRRLAGLDLAQLEAALYDQTLLTPNNCFDVVLFAKEIEDDIEREIRDLERSKDKKEDKLEEAQNRRSEAEDNGDDRSVETEDKRIDRYEEQIEDLEDDIDDLERFELKRMKRLRVRADSQCRRFDQGFY